MAILVRRTGNLHVTTLNSTRDEEDAASCVYFEGAVGLHTGIVTHLLVGRLFFRLFTRVGLGVFCFTREDR